MAREHKVILNLLLLSVTVCACSAENATNNSVEVKDDEFIGRMIEEGI